MSPSNPVSRRDFLRLSAASAAATVLTATPLPALAATAKPHPLTKAHSPDVLVNWVKTIYDLVRQERFSPTSAARAYGGLAVAAYEAVVPGMPADRSLAGQLNDLTPGPVDTKGVRIHWPISLNAALERAALTLFADRSEASRTAISEYAQSVRGGIGSMVPGDVASTSERFDRAVGDHVAAWIATDGYTEILGLPYEPPVGPGLWERTPPNFGFALEPYWEWVRPMALPSADFCAPPPPVPYSALEGSDFYEQAMVLYRTSLEIGDAEREIALFWRDNPDGTTGLPSGHWMLIACVAIADLGLDLARAAEVLAMVGISLTDGFTSCWTEKYRTNLLRPVTYIRNHIDPDWASFVNSPAFPEYTSGHSVGSGAAAGTLTALLGDLPFVDDTGVPYGRGTFQYASFTEAAEVAATSRLYGGIHYPMAIDVGLKQGSRVSRVVRARVKLRRGAGSLG
jgi:hypothetical protein